MLKMPKCCEAHPLRALDRHGPHQPLQHQAGARRRRGLKARDEETYVSVPEMHIDRRLDRITSAIKEGCAQIYRPAARAN